jgi:hypothetical protein
MNDSEGDSTSTSASGRQLVVRQIELQAKIHKNPEKMLQQQARYVWTFKLILSPLL